MSEVNPTPAPTDAQNPAIEPTPAPAPAPTPAPAPAPAAPYAANSGSQQLDVALGYFVANLGLSPESPEIAELRRTGNVEYLRGYAAQAGKLDEISPYLTLATGGLAEIKATADKANEERRVELEGYAGGKEQLAATLAFVKANSSQEQLDQFGEVLDRGGVPAQALMHFFSTKMAAHPGTTVVGQPAVNPNAGAAQPQAATSYANAQEWRAAQRELIAKHGITRYEQTPEGRALMAAFPG